MPIETDALVQVETIHKAMKKTYLPGQIALLALSMLQLAMLTYRLHTQLLNVLVYDAMLVTYGAYLMMAVLCVHHLGEYYLWRRKALTAAADGVFVETRGKNLLERLVLIALAVIFGAWIWSISDDGYVFRFARLSFAVMIGLVLLVNGGKAAMQKLRVSADTNKTVTVLLTVLGTIIVLVVLTHNAIYGLDTYEENTHDYVDTYEFAGRTHYVYDDPIPLTLESLGVEADYEYRSRVQDVMGSLLVTVYNAQEVAPWGTPVQDPNELYYTVTIPRFRGLVSACAEDILDDRRVINLYGLPVPVDPSLWRAERVYEHRLEDEPSGYYTVVYRDRIVEINFPYVPTAEQVQLTAQVLRDLEIE